MTASPALTPAVHHLRLTRRGRAVVAAVIALPLVAGMASFAVLGSNNDAANANDALTTTSFDYVTVQAGETLWGIAEKLAPADDPRDVVTDIVNLNQLASAEVHPGQKLALPSSF